MRCIAFICLCLAVASATSFNKRRFSRLLNEYQQRGLNRYDDTDDLLQQYGSYDDVDDDEYDDEIRREKYLSGFGKYDREQCSTLDLDDEIEGTEQYGGRRHSSLDLDDEFEGLEHSGRRRSSLDLDDEFDTSDDIHEPTTIGSQLRKKSILRKKLGAQVAREVEEANTKLASRLYKQCKEERDDKNTVVSPVSVQLGLAALNKGARGETRRQIAKIIAGRLPLEQRKQVFKTIARSLKTLRNEDYSPLMHRTKIQSVTGIFISQMTPAQQQWIHWIRTNLGVNVKKCNFQRQPQQCRQMINQFVSQKTQHKMPRIVPQDAITDNTKMVLVNALQLKANWGKQMRQHITKRSPFFPLESEKVKVVEMLKTRGVFKYYEDELVKIVGVPTERKELTLYVIVPKDKDGLTHVEKLHLQDGFQLKQLLDDTDKRVKRVDVQLPKFEIKHKVDVRRTLRQQGVVDAFDCKRADFAGITGVSKYERELSEEHENKYESLKYGGSEDEYETLKYGRGLPRDDIEDSLDISGKEKNLHLNKFIHQASIKITENGITSATGTGSHFDDLTIDDEERIHLNSYRQRLNKRDHFEDIIGYGTSGSSSQYRVKADRAFAFVLKHNPTQQLLLVGRVIDAAQKHPKGQQLNINVVDQL